jgi:hypothetical protein
MAFHTIFSQDIHRQSTPDPAARGNMHVGKSDSKLKKKEV